jgi:phosphoglycolate phosphatase
MASFTLALNAYLISRGYKTQIIHLDDFHNPRNVRYSGQNEIDSYLNYAFNLTALEAEILAPVKRDKLAVDKVLTLLDLDLDTFTNYKHYTIDSGTIIIIEGVLLYRKPIEDYIDCKIFLDISYDEVLKRAEKRDVPVHGSDFLNKYICKYIPVQQWYISHCNPKQKSDFLIDNMDYNFPVVMNG